MHVNRATLDAMAAGYAGPPERLEHYERVVATIDAVERKGATMPYTSRNGHMFSLLDPTGSMVLRLSTDDRDAFLAQFGTTLGRAARPGHGGVRGCAG